MTLQQMQYIVAVDKYRHFVKAADACGVTQSTLSTMIRNLESELDVTIFDRSAHPVCPTDIGEKIISQAKVVIYNMEQLNEIPLMEKAISGGNVVIGIIPTVAPYIIPKFFNKVHKYPGLDVHIIENTTANLVDKLKKAEIDIAILATPLGEIDTLEIPLYYERFYAYVSPDDPLWTQEMIGPNDLPGDELWVLQEGHCFRKQVSTFCKMNTSHATAYESGSISTLIKVVDENGGHTIIPELEIPYLSELQKQNIRPVAEPEPVREISMMIRNDYVKERILNIISEIIKEIIPDNMLDSRLKKFAIKI